MSCVEKMSLMVAISLFGFFFLFAYIHAEAMSKLLCKLIVKLLKGWTRRLEICSFSTGKSLIVICNLPVHRAAEALRTRCRR